MSRTNRLCLDDIRGVHRLVGEVVECRLVPDRQRARLLDGIVRLFDAEVSSVVRFEEFTPGGAVCVTRQDVGGQVHQDLDAVMAHWAGHTGGFDLLKDITIERFTRVQGVAHRPIVCTRRDLMTQEEWLSSSVYRELARHVGLNDMLASTFPMQRPGQVFGMTAQRREDQAVFSPREQLLFSLLNEELCHAYRAGKLTGAGRIEQQLSPRQVELLRMLLLGETPKRIAYKLGLTESTIRTYIRDLYKKIGVSGREELMGRYIRESGIDSAAAAGDVRRA